MFFIRNIQFIFCNVLANDIERTNAANIQAFSLTNSVIHDTTMLTNNFLCIDVNNIARFHWKIV